VSIFKSFLILIITVGICIKGNSCFASNNSVVIKTISYFEDKDKNLTFANAIKSNFRPLNSTSNFGLSNSVFWFKIVIKNNTDYTDLLFEIQNSSLSSVTLFKLGKGKITPAIAGEYIPFSPFKSPNPLFEITIPINNYGIYYIKLSSKNIIQLPIVIDTEYNVLNSISLDQYLFGIYIGIIFVMFFYNLFIYITVRDNNYLYYVIYILTIGFTQICLKGYAGMILWPRNEWLIMHAQILSIGLSGIFSALFALKFLNAKHNSPFFYKLIIVLTQVSIFGIILTLLNFYILAQQLFQLVTGIGSIFIIAFSVSIYKKGYKPALILTISWSFFLGGVIIYILKDIGILKYNIFTSNSILIGSALEVILLSFALADKINIYKKEKEESQAQAMASLQDKERIVSEQNVTLENKVKVRTTELTTTNTNLQKTLTDLKEAQAQLVEAEKMASLGQLTAGIAHEINNPINFVTANVGPLKRDMELLIDAVQNIENLSLTEGSVEEKQQQMEDYKEEIDFDYLKTEINYLLKGIHEGASRTADIVKGLKIFSRLDEGDLKKADINEGLESTLIIANNLIGKKIQVIKNFGDIPVIECYPGKLNQVFLNIISNAVFAISEKFGDKPGGILKITTECDTHKLFIKIEDNGTGMSEAIKNKIYEPFFTTKDVGVGTGLGMSIVHNTIKKHNGQIYLNTAEGVGTEFILELHLIFEENIADYQSEHN